MQVLYSDITISNIGQNFCKLWRFKVCENKTEIAKWCEEGLRHGTLAVNFIVIISIFYYRQKKSIFLTFCLKGPLHLICFATLSPVSSHLFNFCLLWNSLTQHNTTKMKILNICIQPTKCETVINYLLLSTDFYPTINNILVLLVVRKIQTFSLKL